MTSLFASSRVSSVDAETVDIHRLARYLFVENVVRKAPCVISLDEADSPAELFCFCMDLLCKGITLMFGDAGGAVCLGNLTEAQFQEVCACIEAAGIRCKWTMEEDDGNLPPVFGEVTFLQDPMTGETRVIHLTKYPVPNLRFEDHAFVLRADGMRVTVRFALRRLGVE